MTRGELKNLYNRTQKAMIKGTALLHEFHVASDEKYGFAYNDRDIDLIIDSLDYGLGCLSFEGYEMLMCKESKPEAP